MSRKNLRIKRRLLSDYALPAFKDCAISRIHAIQAGYFVSVKHWRWICII